MMVMRVCGMHFQTNITIIKYHISQTLNAHTHIHIYMLDAIANSVGKKLCNEYKNYMAECSEKSKEITKKKNTQQQHTVLIV